MSKKPTMKDFFPMANDWGWSKKERKDQWSEFKGNMETLWDQYQDMQKAAKKAWKAQWETFFSQLMGMQQTVADAIPEDAPTLPGMPSPKEFVKKVKEQQETVNAHAVEQTDKLFNVMVEQQQKAKEAIKDAVERVETTIEDRESAKKEEKEDEPSVKPAAKPAAKKPAAKKPAAKAAPKPAAKPAAKKPAAKPAPKPAPKPEEKQAGN